MAYRPAEYFFAVSAAAIMLPSAANVPAIAAPPKAPKEAGFSLAFVDADVRRVIDAVMGSMLGANYTIDPEITGNISLRTAMPVPASQLVPLLERALAGLDAVVIKRNDGYRIVPRKKARTLSQFGRDRAPQQQAAQPAQISNEDNIVPSSPGYASEVIALKFASAKEIVKVAEDLLGADIITAGSAGRNELVISGSAEERDAARKLIRRFDVDSLADMNFEIWKLEDVDPDTLVAELENIFEPPFDIIGSRVRLVPLPRLRSIMAIAADRSDIGRIEPWIRRLDNGGSGKRKLYSYTVQNGRAREMAASLQLVLGGTGDSQDAAPAPTSRTAAPEPIDVRSNSNNGGTAGNASVGSTAPLPVRAISSGTAALRIVPNEQNNSLLIYANGEEYGFIRDALEKLDQPVVQVLIEATLAEVTLSDDLRYGINFQSLGSIGNSALNIANSSSGSGVPASSFPGFSVSVIGNSVSGVLNTLQSRTNVRVLSAPKLLTLNNETATLQVGDQVPIVTQQAQSVSAAGAPLVNTIELRDTGVILQVTPRVNDSGTIILDISQEVSDVASTTTSGINSPTIQQRKLTSTVATKSGQMIALGGLIRNRQTREKSGIPLLSQIPILGGLFGRTSDTGSRTELIMLITPTVIRSPDDVKRTVDVLIEGLDLTQPLLKKAARSEVAPRLREVISSPPDAALPPIEN